MLVKTSFNTFNLLILVLLFLGRFSGRCFRCNSRRCDWGQGRCALWRLHLLCRHCCQYRLFECTARIEVFANIWQQVEVLGRFQPFMLQGLFCSHSIINYKVYRLAGLTISNFEMKSLACGEIIDQYSSSNSYSPATTALKRLHSL